MFDAWSFARLQACALNGHDVEWLAACCAPDARCLLDGELLGEGPQAVRDGIEAEYRARDPVVRLLDVDGEPVLVECGGDAESGLVQGRLRFVVEAQSGGFQLRYQVALDSPEQISGTANGTDITWSRTD